MILGGGRREFRSSKVRDEEGEKGQRKDGRDLIEEWGLDKKQRGANASYIWDRKGLLGVDPNNTDYLLGEYSYAVSLDVVFAGSKMWCIVN